MVLKLKAGMQSFICSCLQGRPLPKIYILKNLYSQCSHCNQLARTDIQKRSFSRLGVRLWNLILDFIRSQTNISINIDIS